MPNSQADGAAKALAIQSGYGGMCFRFVRICRDVPSGYASAIENWERSTARHADRTVPLGMPAHFDRGTYGHVIISIGGGMFRSTNSATDLIETCSIGTWEQRGYRYVGWTETINGVHVLDPVKLAPTRRRIAMWCFFIHDGRYYEAQLDEGWYRELTSKDVWEGRQDVVGYLGVPMRVWPNPVANPTKFGRPLPDGA